MRITLLLLLISVADMASGDTPVWDISSDTWVATDDQGRKTPTSIEVGPPRPDKSVGIFYFLWLGEHGQSGPHDVSKILGANPMALLERESQVWGPWNAFHHWGEPLFGYYLSDDNWVLQQHARMLADAGVDAVFFDITNQAPYEKNYLALCEAFRAVRNTGAKPPQIAFLCPFWDPARMVAFLYEKLYAPGRYPELWYQWEGKPLVLADPAKVAPEHRDFFTFRKPMPDYFCGPQGRNEWGWLEVYPQHVFRNQAGEAEQMVVGVAQNAVGGKLSALSRLGGQGRSFHAGAWPQAGFEPAVGHNLMEQWARVLEVDPKFVFITGWNEWVAMRLDSFNKVREPLHFVDQSDWEHSRDIEPMRGGHGDAYYYQLVNYIRRYKGVRPQEKAGAPQPITIDGEFSDWDTVSPEYRDHRGDIVHRNHPGWGTAGPYINETGRNDLLRAKVTFDAERIYCYVETSDPLSPASDPEWMLLFLNTDHNGQNAWYGYDYRVSGYTPDKGSAALEGYTENRGWEKIADISFAHKAKALELSLPRTLLKQKAPLDFEFKWADNMHRPDDINAFTCYGDAAPSGRFKYRFFE